MITSSQLAHRFEEAGLHVTWGWQNFCESLHNHDALVVEVDTVEQVQLVVAECTEAGKSIRAVAGWADKFREHCGCSPLQRGGTEERYNESFSWTEASVGQVQLRFSPKFKGALLDGRAVRIGLPRAQEEEPTVWVSAGVQLDELTDALWKRGFSLPTGSIIPHVTAVGLAATGGHGVGKDQPSFAGLITSLRIVTHRGDLVRIDSEHKDFETIRGAHLGLFGIVLSVELTCVPRFWLHEERLPMTLDSMLIELPDLLRSTDYLTLSMVPTHKYWDVRSWHRIGKPAHRREKRVQRSQWLKEVEQHFAVETGAEVLKAIEDVTLHPLLGGYLKLVAKAAISRKRKVRIDTEPHIAHYQVAFPKSIEECSILFPITPRTTELLSNVLRTMHVWLKKAASQQQYPVSYAVYVRFFQGTDGGLSSSSLVNRQPDQLVCAVEALSHLGNPYWPEFRERFIALVTAIPQAKFHLGKHVPHGAQVNDLYPERTVKQLSRALHTWYDDEPAASPFLNPWLRSFLEPVL